MDKKLNEIRLGGLGEVIVMYYGKMLFWGKCGGNFFVWGDKNGRNINDETKYG